MNGKAFLTNDSSSTGQETTLVSSVSSGQLESASSSAIVRMHGSSLQKQMEAIEAAVLAHIRALRAVGKLTANTAEIATALGVSQDLVMLAVEGIRDKGLLAK